MLERDFEQSQSITESPLRDAEILAALTMADFAGLPMEYWPGQFHSPVNRRPARVPLLRLSNRFLIRATWQSVKTSIARAIAQSRRSTPAGNAVIAQQHGRNHQ